MYKSSVSVVGIATRCWLNGAGVQSDAGEIFRTLPYRPWGPPCLLYKWQRVSFAGVKRQGCGVDHPPAYSAEVKERVDI
jgi:hypothetical protein